jgi:hypothetical protein
MRKLIFAIGLGIICFVLVGGCSDQGDDVIRGNGTIIYTSLEGGCWGIALDGSIHYTFENLPESFRNEGLRVSISAKLTEPHAVFCDLGPFINVIDIRRI